MRRTSYLAHTVNMRVSIVLGSRYFGGSLELVNMDGFGGCLFLNCVFRRKLKRPSGTDVYLRLPRLVRSQSVCNQDSHSLLLRSRAQT